jgi:hypothetical protein
MIVRSRIKSLSEKLEDDISDLNRWQRADNHFFPRNLLLSFLLGVEHCHLLSRSTFCHIGRK